MINEWMCLIDTTPAPAPLTRITAADGQEPDITAAGSYAPGPVCSPGAEAVPNDGNGSRTTGVTTGPPVTNPATLSAADASFSCRTVPAEQFNLPCPGSRSSSSTNKLTPLRPGSPVAKHPADSESTRPPDG
jgi:hypothetical protein